MGADHGDWVAGFPVLTDGEGDNGGGIAGEVVLAAGLKGGIPRVSFLGRALGGWSCSHQGGTYSDGLEAGLL